MNRAEFDGTPFAAGSVTGLRAFRVDDECLGSPSQHHDWWPGVNRAHCALATVFPDHKPGAVDCSCGFYAYYDGSNEYLYGGNVAGVIEGHGRITYGNRGFRCEKARIVALALRGSRGTSATAALRHMLWFWMIYWTVMGSLYLRAGHVASAVIDYAILLGFMVFWFLSTSGGLGGLVHRRKIKRFAKFYDVPLYPNQKKMLKAHPLTTFDKLPS